MVKDKVLHINDESFEKVVSSGITVVDFWAQWCGPCRMQGPILDSLAAKVDDSVKVCKLDVDSYQQNAAKYGVSSIPSLFIFKDGEVKKQFVGVQSEDTLSAAINELK